MKKSKKQQWILAVACVLPFHLAFAGIPVVDGVNLSQTTISAIQNVAAVTKQIEQYKTQLQQYQIMLRNSATPADYIWSQADQTISMLLAAQDTLSYYKTQAGSLEKYLERYQDTAHYESNRKHCAKTLVSSLAYSDKQPARKGRCKPSRLPISLLAHRQISFCKFAAC